MKRAQAAPKAIQPESIEPESIEWRGWSTLHLLPVLPLCAAAFLFSFLFLAAAPPSSAQEQADPLTPQQTEDLREAADDPVKKLELYLGYLGDRVTELHRLSVDAGSAPADAQIHRVYDEFTSISDELDDNLDAYDQQHADLRKALKEILEKSGMWPQALKEPKTDPAYDFARTEALDSLQSTQDDARQFLDSETKYFAHEKKDKKDKSGS